MAVVGPSNETRWQEDPDLAVKEQLRFGSLALFPFDLVKRSLEKGTKRNERLRWHSVGLRRFVGLRCDVVSSDAVVVSIRLVRPRPSRRTKAKSQWPLCCEEFPEK